MRPGSCGSGTLGRTARDRGSRFYVLTEPVRQPTSGPFGDTIFLFYVFTDLLCLPTSGASGGSIFLLVKKDRGERHAKGLQSRPLETCFDTGERRGDVRRSYEFAGVQLTRFRPVRGVRKRTASTDSCVLRPDGDAQHHRKKCPWGALPRSRYCLRFSTAPQ